MDREVQKIRPDYNRIYSDVLKKKYPHKIKECEALLNKENLSAIDIIELNLKIFGRNDLKGVDVNQKHRSYSSSDILYILNYQKKNKLNNSQLSIHFKLSRNTITKWKRIFQLD